MSYTKDENGNIVKKPLIEHLGGLFKKKKAVPMPQPPPQPASEPQPTTEDYLKAIINNQEMIYGAIDVLRKKLNDIESEDEEPEEELSEEQIEEALKAYKESMKKKSPGRPKKKK